MRKTTTVVESPRARGAAASPFQFGASSGSSLSLPVEIDRRDGAPVIAAVTPTTGVSRDEMTSPLNPRSRLHRAALNEGPTLAVCTSALDALKFATSTSNSPHAFFIFSSPQLLLHFRRLVHFFGASFSRITTKKTS